MPQLFEYFQSLPVAVWAWQFVIIALALFVSLLKLKPWRMEHAAETVYGVTAYLIFLVSSMIGAISIWGAQLSQARYSLVVFIFAPVVLYYAMQLLDTDRRKPTPYQGFEKVFSIIGALIFFGTYAFFMLRDIESKLHIGESVWNPLQVVLLSPAVLVLLAWLLVPMFSRFLPNIAYGRTLRDFCKKHSDAMAIILILSLLIAIMAKNIESFF